MIKRMNGGIFEDGESLLIVTINFAYDTNMVVYPALRSDTPVFCGIANTTISSNLFFRGGA